jgi:phosphopantetheinyl transferase
MVIYWVFSKYSIVRLQEYFENPERYFGSGELNEYRRFVVPKRKMEWLASRILIKRLVINSVESTLNLSPRSIVIRKKPSGVPFVEFAGIGKVGWLSMSHSNDGVFTAFSINGLHHFGVDLEFIEERSPQLIADYFTESEARWVNASKGEEKKFLVNLIWSAKETYLKAIGKGLQLDTRRVEIKGINPNCVDTEWCDLDFQANVQETRNWRILFKRKEDFVQTMCVPADKKIEFVRMDVELEKPIH